MIEDVEKTEDAGEKTKSLSWTNRCFYHWGLLVDRSKIKVSVGILCLLVRLTHDTIESYKEACSSSSISRTRFIVWIVLLDLS